MSQQTPQQEEEKRRILELDKIGTSMNRGFSVQTIAVVAMIVAILFPAASYSYKMTPENPNELIIAVCIGLFASVVLLWVLDATSILPFRADWVSKGIWGIGISSIIATSVLVYKVSMDLPKYPLQGSWEIKIKEKDKPHLIADHHLSISYSENAHMYWGFSDINSIDTLQALWLEVNKFTPEDNTMELNLVFQNGKKIALKKKLNFGADNAFANSVEANQKDLNNNYIVSISRSK